MPQLDPELFPNIDGKYKPYRYSIRSYDKQMDCTLLPVARFFPIPLIAMSASIILKAQRLQVVRVSITIKWQPLETVAKVLYRMSKVSCPR